MNTKQKQLQSSFEANEATSGNSDELKDMMELFSYSSEDFFSEVENDIAQMAEGKTLLLHYY